jgi:DNA repair protein RecO (recombination protein O)
MGQVRYSSEGVVLARKNYSEADRILTVFTKNKGKLRLIAKGVRRPKSRKRGHIEIFSLINFSATKGKILDVITEVETINQFKAIRENLKKISVAYFLMEAILRLTQEEEKNELFYEIVRKYLKNLEVSSNLRNLRKTFIYEALVEMGFWPRSKKMFNHDQILEEILERNMNTVRIGKKILT